MKLIEFSVFGNISEMLKSLGYSDFPEQQLALNVIWDKAGLDRDEEFNSVEVFKLIEEFKGQRDYYFNILRKLNMAGSKHQLFVYLNRAFNLLRSKQDRLYSAAILRGMLINIPDITSNISTTLGSNIPTPEPVVLNKKEILEAFKTLCNEINGEPILEDLQHNEELFLKTLDNEREDIE